MFLFFENYKEEGKVSPKYFLEECEGKEDDESN